MCLKPSPRLPEEEHQTHGAAVTGPCAEPGGPPPGPPDRANPGIER